MPVVVVLAYCVHMHRSGLEHSTIAGRLVAITFEDRASDFPDPCRDFSIHKALERWAKSTRKH